MGSKYSCFFILFVLLFLSSLSSSLAEEESQVYNITDGKFFQLVMKTMFLGNFMGVIEFNNSDYVEQGYEDIAKNYYSPTFLFFRINTETFDDKEMIRKYHNETFPTFRIFKGRSVLYGKVIGWKPRLLEWRVSLYTKKREPMMTLAAE